MTQCRIASVCTLSPYKIWVFTLFGHVYHPLWQFWDIMATQCVVGLTVSQPALDDVEIRLGRQVVQLDATENEGVCFAGQEGL